MKIGILTFHRGPNHGGFLQAYELAKAIEKLGGEAEIIDYQNAHHAQSEKFRPWVYRNPMSAYYAWSKQRVFKRCQKNLPLSARFRSSDDVDWNRYDTVVIGSDVVWDYQDPRFGHDGIYFGDFKRRYRGKLASYAASAGTVDGSKLPPNWVSDGLKGFDHISVRDENTAEMVCSAAVVQPSIVVDPTWLPIRDDDRSDLAHKPDGGYIAVYAYQLPTDVVKSIQCFASKHQLKIVAGGYSKRWADKNLPNLTPDEWVEFSSKASYVITGTFHGALYSMRLGKSFGVVSNHFISQKLATPLAMVGLEERLLSQGGETLEDVLESGFDRTAFRKAIDPLVDQSWSYLESILK